MTNLKVNTFVLAIGSVSQIGCKDIMSGSKVKIVSTSGSTSQVECSDKKIRYVFTLCLKPIESTLEVGKTYKRVTSNSESYTVRSSSFTVIWLDDKSILTENQKGLRLNWNSNQLGQPNYHDLSGWKEVIADKYVVLTYKTTCKDSVETGSETFPSEQSARDRWASNPLFAGVCKLETTPVVNNT